jgi:hypothetical protein
VLGVALHCTRQWGRLQQRWAMWCWVICSLYVQCRTREGVYSSPQVAPDVLACNRDTEMHSRSQCLHRGAGCNVC